MKRAAGYPVGSTTLQIDEIADHFHNLGRIQNPLHRIARYHAPVRILELFFFHILDVSNLLLSLRVFGIFLSHPVNFD